MQIYFLQVPWRDPENLNAEAVPLSPSGEHYYIDTLCTKSICVTTQRTFWWEHSVGWNQAGTGDKGQGDCWAVRLMPRMWHLLSLQLGEMFVCLLFVCTPGGPCLLEGGWLPHKCLLNKFNEQTSSVLVKEVLLPSCGQDKEIWIRY